MSSRISSSLKLYFILFEIGFDEIEKKNSTGGSGYHPDLNQFFEINQMTPPPSPPISTESFEATPVMEMDNEGSLLFFFFFSSFFSELTSFSFHRSG